MAYVILIGIAAVAALVYVILLYGSVPGIMEERFGEYELPEVNVWHRDDDSAGAEAAAEEGLYREVRYLAREAGLFGGQSVIKQVRYRSLDSDKIERVDKDEVIRLKRTKKQAS